MGLKKVNTRSARLASEIAGQRLCSRRSFAPWTEGARIERIQTWDGNDWNTTSDWNTGGDSVIAPMVKEAAAKYGG